MIKAITALLLFLALSNNVTGQTTQMKNRELVDMLFTKLNPDLPENYYLPPLAKDKLRWMSVQYNSKPRRLLISKTDRWADRHLEVLATTINYPGQIPVITVSAEAIGSAASQLTLDQLKDLFLATMTHEVIHTGKTLRPDATFQEKFEEELRTWNIWIPQVIRPLIAKGHALPFDWVAADDILKKCADNTDCLPWKEIVKIHTTK